MTHLRPQLGIAGTILAVLLSWQRLQQAAPAELTKEALARAAAQLGYKSAWVDRMTYPSSFTQGLYLARQDDPRSWEEIVGARPKRDPERLWAGLVVVAKDIFLTPDANPGEMQVGPLRFFGDAAEISRLTRHFGWR